MIPTDVSRYRVSALANSETEKVFPLFRMDLDISSRLRKNYLLEIPCISNFFFPICTWDMNFSWSTLKLLNATIVHNLIPSSHRYFSNTMKFKYTIYPGIFHNKRCKEKSRLKLNISFILFHHTFKNYSLHRTLHTFILRIEFRMKLFRVNHLILPS